MLTTDALADGHRALAETRWDAARDAFADAVTVDGGSGAAWEGLSWAAWWKGDAEETLRSRERAYRAYRAERDFAAAARTAAFLASDEVEFEGDLALAEGWMGRARRLLEDAPEGPDAAWLLAVEGVYALYGRADVAAAAAYGRETQRLGRVHDVADLEAVGLALEGAAHLIGGDVGEGLPLLAESAALASTEDFTYPATPVWTFCLALTASTQIGDLERATSWATMLPGDLGGVVQALYQLARGHVLTAMGSWDEAEAALQESLDIFRSERPGKVARALVRLGDLRVLQGRLDEARDHFERARPMPAAAIGLGQLALLDGDAASAADAAERVLRGLGDGPVAARFPALELLARARATQGDAPAAERAADELARDAARLGTCWMHGRATLVRAELALAAGDAESARCHAEDAMDRLLGCSAAPAAALARHVLACALAALGRTAAAETEAAAARAAFEALGAPVPAAPTTAVAVGPGSMPAAPTTAVAAAAGSTPAATVAAATTAVAAAAGSAPAATVAAARTAVAAAAGSTPAATVAAARAAVPAPAAEVASEGVASAPVAAAAAARAAAVPTPAAEVPATAASPSTDARSDEAAALAGLSPRELEVLRLVAQGLSDAAIAAELFLSPHTVHRHVANTRAKLRLPSRAAAVGYAARAGLL